MGISKRTGAGAASGNRSRTHVYKPENPKWTQNPQYLLHLKNEFLKEDIHLKVLKYISFPLFLLTVKISSCFENVVKCICKLNNFKNI